MAPFVGASRSLPSYPLWITSDHALQERGGSRLLLKLNTDLFDQTLKRCSCGGGCDASPPGPWLSPLLEEAERGFLSVVGRPVAGFCCPLCNRELLVACATVAHAPAEAVGGRPVVFLCRRCNSFLGTAYEASAKAMFARLAHGDAGQQILKVRYGRPGGPQIHGTATVTTTPEGIVQLSVDGPKPDAFVIDDFRQHGMRGIHLSYREETEQHFKLALLSWAMLALFRRFGYTFALGHSSRAARAAILGRTLEPLGEAFCFTVGDWPSQIPSFVPAIVMAQRDSQGGSATGFDLIGFGASAGRVVVCLPFEADPEALRVRGLERLADDDGSFVRPVIPISFDELFEESADVTHLGGSCSYALDEDDGDRLVVLASSPATAAETLRMAANPGSTRHAQTLVADHTHDDWQLELRDLPHRVTPSEWMAVFGADLDDRLASLGLPAATATPPDHETPEMLIARLSGLVPDHLVMHLRDALRVFVNLEPTIEPREAGATGRVTKLLDRYVREHRLRGSVWYAFSAGAPAELEELSSYSVLLFDDERSHVVGPFYTISTLMQAVEEALRAWRSPP
jgi:hypothetical protein